MFTPKQYVEIFHLIFIRHLEQKLDKNLYALKGGCNLRFFFKSIRYSEDIDLDVRIVGKDTLRSKINKLLASASFLQSLKVKGIEIQNTSEPEQTETTQRWKISLKVDGVSMTLPTKIEFSRRNMDENSIFEPIDKDLIQAYQLYPVFAKHYTLNAAFAQKVHALINRTETQARDIFDLKVLLDLGADPKQLDIALKEKREIAIANALSVGFPEFKSQVVAYLLNEYQEYYHNPTIWDKTQIEVISALEAC